MKCNPHKYVSWDYMVCTFILSGQVRIIHVFNRTFPFGNIQLDIFLPFKS